MIFFQSLFSIHAKSINFDQELRSTYQINLELILGNAIKILKI